MSLRESRSGLFTQFGSNWFRRGEHTWLTCLEDQSQAGFQADSSSELAPSFCHSPDPDPSVSLLLPPSDSPHGSKMAAKDPGFSCSQNTVHGPEFPANILRVTLMRLLQAPACLWTNSYGPQDEWMLFGRDLLFHSKSQCGIASLCPGDPRQKCGPSGRGKERMDPGETHTDSLEDESYVVLHCLYTHISNTCL